MRPLDGYLLQWTKEFCKYSKLLPSLSDYVKKTLKLNWCFYELKENKVHDLLKNYSSPITVKIRSSKLMHVRISQKSPFHQKFRKNVNLLSSRKQCYKCLNPKHPWSYFLWVLSTRDQPMSYKNWSLICIRPKKLLFEVVAGWFWVKNNVVTNQFWVKNNVVTNQSKS